jgi:class 3 adenylate cyclase/Tfp pilus assembly protein PilF
MYLRSLICILFCISLISPAAAKLQGQALIDSLLKELPKAKEDTDKANILVNLTWEYRFVNPDEGLKYGKNALEILTRIGLRNKMADCYNGIGYNYFNKSDFKEALSYFSKSLELYKQLTDKKHTGGVLCNIGNVYLYQGNNDIAMDNYQQALKVLEEGGYKDFMANVIGNIGAIYKAENNYPAALEYYYKALKLHEGLKDTIGISANLQNIANIYLEHKEYIKAVENYSTVLDLIGNNDMQNKGYVLSDLAVVYHRMGDYEKALEYNDKALVIEQKFGDKRSIANTLANMGIVYTLQKNYVVAISYLKQALEIAKVIGTQSQEALANVELGACYLAIAENADNKKEQMSSTPEVKTADYKPGKDLPKTKTDALQMAIKYLLDGKLLAEKINDADNLITCYKHLADVYKLKGDYKLVTEYQDKFIALNDSNTIKENEKAVTELQMQYDYDKKSLADSLKNAEKEKAEHLKLQRQKTFTYTGLAAAILLLGFTLLLFRNNKLLDNEKKRSENLLLNILPNEVAGELKEKGSAAAREFNNVTVLFTDFVNFTEAGERMSPQALIDELHECFKAFDEIIGKYNIEKIKTIGDAYLAVCGLPIPDEHHAENTVKAAIEIREFMDKRYAHIGNRTFEIRLGIHSGSVVAGIVGVKKFAYDIWGDTVNTAARMEQNSEPGKINISQSTYELVKGKFDCGYRGEIEVKNKGMMKMYYVG